MRIITFLNVLLISSATLANSLVTEIPEATPSIIKHEQLTYDIVLNGRSVTQSESAWNHSVLLGLYSDKKLEGSCSGTIIAKDTILTASHCLKDHIKKVRIIFGLDNRNGTSVDSVETQTFVRARKEHSPSLTPTTVSNESTPSPYLLYDKDQQKEFHKWFTELRNLHIVDHEHSQRSKERQHDVALVFFKNGLPRGFRPANWYKGDLPRLKEKLYSFGYGINNRDLKKSTIALREGIIKTYGYSVITTQEKQWPLILFGYSGSAATNVCNGDSGAGVFALDKKTGEPKLIAVHSAGFNGCSETTFEVLLHYYSDWIQSAIKSYRSSTFL